MNALLITALLAVSTQAQTDEAARAKKAAESLKAYTDTFRVPSGDLFPPPPPITEFTAKEVDALNFASTNAKLGRYSKEMGDYLGRFDWDEENPSDGVKLDAERFQVAYGLASKGGKDLDAAGRWVCGLAVALRGYFHFYNEENGGSMGSQIGHATWGVGTGPVDKIHAVNGWIAKRYKEASKVDLNAGGPNRLNYASLERCTAAVQEANHEQVPKPEAKLIPSVMHKPDPEQTFLRKDLSDIDLARYDYWVLYYDASWQSWGYVANSSKKWRPTAESLKKFINCRAPEWVGNYVARAPKEAEYKLSYFPEGGVTLRHPDQPASAKARSRAAIDEARKRYCR